MRKRSFVLLVPTALALAGGGCVTTTVGRPRPPVSAEPARVARPRTAVLSAGVLPIGSVPYDNRSLPLVSPDGRFCATQAGGPRPWETILAAQDATVPGSSRIEIHALDPQRQRTIFHVRLGEPLLLGRSCDGGGFLVESPRPDGARWIGYATWYSGAVEWLAADEQVNAFGCRGPDGRLAWSRRARDAGHFDLVIRSGGEEWTVAAQGGDWLLPIWAGDGDGLFVLRLEDEALELTYMSAESPESTRESIVRLRLGSEMTRHDAYQCLASHAYTAGVPHPGGTFLLFWHPAADRIGLWRPLSSPGAATLLEPGSMAAVVDPSGFVLVATPDRLVVQRPASLSDRRTLLLGAHVPRPIDSALWPYVLLSPTDDRIDLMAMRLLHE